MNQSKFLLTLREAAEALSISERYLRSLTKAGTVPCIRLGRSVRYRPAEVEAALEKLQGEQARAAS